MRHDERRNEHLGEIKEELTAIRWLMAAYLDYTAKTAIAGMEITELIRSGSTGLEAQAEVLEEMKTTARQLEERAEVYIHD